MLVTSHPPAPTSRDIVIAACTAIVAKVRHLGDCAIPHLTEMAAYAFDDAARGVEEVCQELVNELPLGIDLLRGQDGDTQDDLRRQVSTLKLELADTKQEVQRLSGALSSMDATFSRRSELCRKETGNQYGSSLDGRDGSAAASSGGTTGKADLNRYLNFILEVTDAKEMDGVNLRLVEARKLLQGTPNEQALMLQSGGHVAEALDTVVALRKDNLQLEQKMVASKKSYESTTAALQKEIVVLRRKIRDDDAALKEVRTIQRRLEKRARKMAQALRQAMADRQAMLLSANLKEVEARTQRHLMAQQVASLETRLEVELRRRLGKASASDDPSNLEATHDLYLDASAKRLRNPNREMLDRLVKECEACPSDPSVTVSAARALRIRLNSQSEELALWRCVAIDANAKRQAATRQAITAEEDLGRLLASARERGVDLPSDLANARLNAELQGLTDGDVNFREMVRTLRSERAETLRRVHAIRRDLEVLLEGADTAEARKSAAAWAKSRREGLGVADMTTLETELSRFETVGGELANKLQDDSKARRMAQRDLELVDKRLGWERQLTYRQWRVLINSLPPSVGSQVDANGVISIRNDECSQALVREVAKWKADVQQYAIATIQAAEEEAYLAKGIPDFAHTALDPIDEELLLAQEPSPLSLLHPARPIPPPPPVVTSHACQTDPFVRAPANIGLMRNTSTTEGEGDEDESALQTTFLTAVGSIVRRATVNGRVIQRPLISSGVQTSAALQSTSSVEADDVKDEGTSTTYLTSVDEGTTAMRTPVDIPIKVVGSHGIDIGVGDDDHCLSSHDVGCIARPKVSEQSTQSVASLLGSVHIATQCELINTISESRARVQPSTAKSGNGVGTTTLQPTRDRKGSSTITVGEGADVIEVSSRSNLSPSSGAVVVDESTVDSPQGSGDASADVDGQSEGTIDERPTSQRSPPTGLSSKQSTPRNNNGSGPPTGSTSRTESSRTRGSPTPRQLISKRSTSPSSLQSPPTLSRVPSRITVHASSTPVSTNSPDQPASNPTLEVNAQSAMTSPCLFTCPSCGVDISFQQELTDPTEEDAYYEDEEGEEGGGGGGTYVEEGDRIVQDGVEERGLDPVQRPVPKRTPINATRNVRSQQPSSSTLRSIVAPIPRRIQLHRDGSVVVLPSPAILNTTSVGTQCNMPLHSEDTHHYPFSNGGEPPTPHPLRLPLPIEEYHQEDGSSSLVSPLFNGARPITPQGQYPSSQTLSASSPDQLEGRDGGHISGRLGTDDTPLSRPSSGSKSGTTKRPTSSSGAKLPRPSTAKVRSLTMQLGSSEIHSPEYEALVVRLASASLRHHSVTPIPGSTALFAFEGAEELLNTSRLLHQCAALVNVLLLTASSTPMANMGAVAQLPSLTFHMVCLVEAVLRDLGLGEGPLPNAVPYLLCSRWGPSPPEVPDPTTVANMEGQPLCGPRWGNSVMRKQLNVEVGCIDGLSAAADKLGMLPARLAPFEATKLRSVIGALSEQLNRLLPAGGGPPPLLNPPRSHSSQEAGQRPVMGGWDAKRPASGLSTTSVAFEGQETTRSMLPPTGKLGRKPPLGSVNAERAQMLLRSLSPPVPMFHSTVPTLQVLSPVTKRLHSSPNVASPSDLRQSLATAFQTQFKK